LLSVLLATVLILGDFFGLSSLSGCLSPNAGRAARSQARAPIFSVLRTAHKELPTVAL
jgi:hypothetical protein